MKLYKPVLMFLCAAVLLAVLPLGLTTCGEPGTGAYVMDTTAVLNSLTIIPSAGAAYSKSAQAPAPIDEFTYDDFDNSMGGEEFSTLRLWHDDHFINARISPNASRGARIYYGIGDEFNRPAYFTDYRVPVSFAANDFLYIKVTSEDTEITNYYRFYVPVYKAGTHLADVYIGEKGDKRGDIEEGGDTWSKAQQGRISIALVDSQSRKIRAFGQETSSTFRFARVLENSTAAPSFQAFPPQEVTEGEVNIGTEENPIMVPNKVTYYTLSYDLLDQDMLYIEVTAENTIDKAFYKFNVSVQRIATIKTLNMVDDNGKYEVMGKGVPGINDSALVDPGTTNPDTFAWNNARAGGFQTADQLPAGYAIEVILDDPMATYQYGLISTIGAGLSTFSTTTGKVKFDNANALAIKVTSHNGKGIHYYKIKVDLLAGLFRQHPISAVYYYYKPKSDVSPINPTKKVPVLVPKLDENNQPVLDDDDEPVMVQKTEQAKDADDNLLWDDEEKTIPKMVPVWDTVPTPEEEYMYIDYFSPTVFTSDDAVITNIKELEGILDRTVAGATYQWYEANSWYGGYGFDPDGNIMYVDAEGNTMYANADGTQGIAKLEDSKFNGAGGYEDPYDKFHADQFDEKKNPSLFNGGNQGPAHYVLPGRKIPQSEGGRSQRYRPKINRRPFITGWSTETHYYWVEITDPITGYVATSGRAVIVSERNKEKKHYIIDTNNDYKNSDNIPLPFKNVIPFKQKYDYFRIPLKFGLVDGKPFNIMDYSVMYAQAKFYLVDGTPWIQNWTNGNLAFEINGVEFNDVTKNPASQYTKDGNVAVLYYNLTNNNATYSIDGDVKEPAGGYLGTNPTHVVISPSGDHTKGTNKNGYPPLNSQGMAASSIVGTDLQGWFCGFIELVELRFESPGRN